MLFATPFSLVHYSKQTNFTVGERQLKHWPVESRWRIRSKGFLFQCSPSASARMIVSDLQTYLLPKQFGLGSGEGWGCRGVGVVVSGGGGVGVWRGIGVGSYVYFRTRVPLKRENLQLFFHELLLTLYRLYKMQSCRHRNSVTHDPHDRSVAYERHLGLTLINGFGGLQEAALQRFVSPYLKLKNKHKRCAL